jgi:magnesium transporter
MLVNCVAYQDGKKLADIGIDEISDYIVRPDCFVWVALRDASDDELMQMQREFGLHDLAIEDARHGHQRPKVEEYGDIVYAVLHMIEFGATDELRVGELNIFAGTNFVLSIRNRSQQGFLGVRERAEREPHLLRHGTGFVFYALMDAVVDRYFPVIDALETELEAIEAQIFERGTARANIEHLYALKQRILTVKHAVAPLLEATGKLTMGRVPSVCQSTREYFRDVYDHLVRINTTLDTLREAIGTGIQVNLSLVAIEESETTKRLAAWAGIFAVATALVGVWGMNFEHMPELKWKWGYAFALTTIVTACSLLYWRFKRAGWL